MINKRAKFHRTTSKGIKWLREHGYLVDIIPHTRFHLDLFGIADAVAIKDGEVYFIQLKTNTWGNAKIYEDFFHKHHVNIILMMFKDRKKEPYTRIWSRFPKDFFAKKQ